MKPLAVTPLGTFYLLCYFYRVYFLICYNTFVKAVPYCPKFTLYPSFLNFFSKQIYFIFAANRYYKMCKSFINLLYLSVCLSQIYISVLFCTVFVVIQEI